jgi:hypothetical protein
MKSTLIAALILASSIIQLGYAAPSHRGAARNSHHQLGRHLQNPQDQDNWLGGTGNWSNGSDWSLHAPPGQADDATIGGVSDYVYFDVGTSTINSLTLSGTLTDNGVASQLTAGFLNVTSTGVLDFSASPISLTSFMPSTNYGKMAVSFVGLGTDFMGAFLDNYGVLKAGGFYIPVSAQLTSESGATLTTGGGEIEGGGLSNSGNWDLFGGIAVGVNKYGGSLGNSGVLTIHSGGGIGAGRDGFIGNSGTINNYGTISAAAYDGESGEFSNAGVLNNYGTVTSYASFSNSGSVVNTGTVYIGSAIAFGGGLNTGSYVQNGPNSFTIVDSTFTTSTPLQINGGLLTGSGIIAGDVNMSGTLRAGDHNIPCANSPCRTLTIQGNYQQFGIGTLYTELDGTLPGQTYDQLVISGKAALDGTLDVVIPGGNAWEIGTAFFPLTYGSESGIFSTLDLPSLPPGEAWNYAYESTDFKLWITSVPEPSSLVLLGGGLLAITGMLRRKLF